MLKMLVFAFIALLLVTVRANPVQNPLTYNVEELEESCARQGGICMRYQDCEPQNMVRVPTYQSLCPNQERLGVICCYV